jgi:hypothetical protein
VVDVYFCCGFLLEGSTILPESPTHLKEHPIYPNQSKYAFRRGFKHPQPIFFPEKSNSSLSATTHIDEHYDEIMLRGKGSLLAKTS